MMEEIEKPSETIPVPSLMTTTGTDKYDLVLHCTGFGPFSGVPENPTSMLMQTLPSQLSLGDTPLPPSVKCASFTVLETSFQGSRSQLDEIYETGLLASNGGHTIYLHIGTTPSHVYNLEACAYNELNYCVPDERGFQPRSRKVREEDVLGMVRETGLPTDELVEKMRGFGWNEAFVKKSTDPGRFVCNSTDLIFCLAESAKSLSLQEEG